MSKTLSAASKPLVAEATAPPPRRGRKPITDPMHLTPSDKHLLVWLDVNGSGPEGVSISKLGLAQGMGLNVKTVDRSVSSLRRRGMLEVVPCYMSNGGQVSNVYRVTLLARRTYPDLFE